MTSHAHDSSSTASSGPAALRSHLTGWIMVAIQALLFLAIGFWPASWSPDAPAYLWPSLALVVGGAAIMVAAALGLGKALTPLPEPNGAGLRAQGIYHWVRHPMYTGVLIVCVGVSVGRGELAVWAFTAVLAAFFDAKTRMEERYLIATYDGYLDYAGRTGKFVPWLGKRRGLDSSPS